MTELNMRFSEDEQSRNMRRGALAGVATQIVRVATQAGSVVLLSRLLTPSDFGTYAMASPVLAFAVLFQDLGLGHATVQKDELTQDELSSLFWVNLSVGALLAVTQVMLSPLVAMFYGDPDLAALTSGMSLTLLLSGADVQHLSLLTRQMRFWTLAGLESAAALSGLLTSIVMAFFCHSYWAILAGSLASGVVLAGGAWLSSGWLPSKPSSITGARDMLNFGLGVTGFNLAEFLSRNTDGVLIGKVWGAAPLGAYNRAYRLLLFPLQQVTNPMIRIMLPTLSSLLKEPERYRDSFRRAVLPAFLVVLPGVAFMIASADTLVEILLGAQWRDVTPIFVGLSVAGLLQTTNSPANWLFLSQGRTREYMRWGMFSALTSMLAFACGLHFGPVGVASAYSLSECLRTPMLWWLVGRDGPIRHRDVIKVIGPHLVGAIASVAAALLLHRWLLMQSIDAVPNLAACFCMSYAVSFLIVALFPVSRDEIRRYVPSFSSR
ncbi:lipopolysaccharide biosynthesis protein [Bradyrhizobium sp. WSM 1704]|uniref:lipopolysaccharide biosynthesis protein n=1 Tax=Bradyrhizobium semiaridum TaxID=2821404 RepID=UPI001CE24A4D|nr:lipopolysaccharide biosynthesis protein [Bradyrhizobium semiaridum]MCA6125515.1 lipopolysaccharide biosynthesis protein [Bradyrhizobium semiaridum]